MTTLLTNNVALLACAPNGIQKLRSLIRRLAVMGRLTGSESEPCAVKEWRHTTFGQVFSLEYGESLPAPKRTGTGEFPVYGSNGVVGSHAECCVAAPCLVVGRKGSAGAVNVCEHHGCWVTDVAYYCVPPDEVTLRFTYLLFLTLGLDELGKGIKPGLSRNEAYVLPVSIPPLAEQHRIVAKVDELMALCDRLETRQSDAQAAHARLVDELLGSLLQARDAEDFAECWGRLSSRFEEVFSTEGSFENLRQAVIHCACTGRMTSGRPDSRKTEVAETNHLPELPPEWQWTKFGDLCVLVTSGSRGWKDYYSESGSTFIRSQDIKYDRLEFDNRAYVCLPENSEGSRTQVKKEDILITITGANVGKSALLTNPPEDAYVSQHVALIRLKETKFAEFIHYWLINNLGGRKILLSASYGAKPGLNLQNIKDLPIPLPPLEEQHRIVAKLDELLDLCDGLKVRIRQARQMQERLAGTLVERAML